MDKNYILFMGKLPRRAFQRIGLSNPLGGFRCSIHHYDDRTYRAQHMGLGGFRYQPTKLIHGHLYSDTDVMAMKLVDWNIGCYIDAVMVLDDDKVEWFNRIEQHGLTRYHIRKFIASRLLNFDGHHTVP